MKYEKTLSTGRTDIEDENLIFSVSFSENESKLFDIKAMSADYMTEEETATFVKSLETATKIVLKAADRELDEKEKSNENKENK